MYRLVFFSPFFAAAVTVAAGAIAYYGRLHARKNALARALRAEVAATQQTIAGVLSYSLRRLERGRSTGMPKPAAIRSVFESGASEIGLLRDDYAEGIAAINGHIDRIRQYADNAEGRGTYREDTGLYVRHLLFGLLLSEWVLRLLRGDVAGRRPSEPYERDWIGLRRETERLWPTFGITPEAISEWLKPKLRPQKHPREVAIVAEIPKSVTGKPLKDKLRKDIESGVAPTIKRADAR